MINVNLSKAHEIITKIEQKINSIKPNPVVKVFNNNPSKEDRDKIYVKCHNDLTDFITLIKFKSKLKKDIHIKNKESGILDVITEINIIKSTISKFYDMIGHLTYLTNNLQEYDKTDFDKVEDKPMTNYHVLHNEVLSDIESKIDDFSKEKSKLENQVKEKNYTNFITLSDDVVNRLEDMKIFF